MSGKGWSEERRKAHSEKMRERWADPEFRARQVAACGADGENRAERMRDRWADPQVREQLSEAIRQSWNDDDERRKKSSEVLMAARNRPGYAERQRQAKKAYHARVRLALAALDAQEAQQ